MLCANLSKYLDGELTPGEERQMEAHLQDCESCHLEVLRWEDILTRIRSLPQYAPGPAPSTWQTQNLMHKARLRLEGALEGTLEGTLEGKGEASSDGGVLGRGFEQKAVRSPVRFRWPFALVGVVGAAACLAVLLPFPNLGGPLVDGGGLVGDWARSLEQSGRRAWVAIAGSPSEDGAPPEEAELRQDAPPSVSPRSPGRKPLRIVRASGAPRVMALDEHRVVVGAKSRGQVIRRDKHRTVLEVERGTLAFEVAPRAPGQLFVVEAADVRVEVVGTRFFVTRTLRDKGDSDIKVGVAKGAVDVIFAGSRLRVGAGQVWERGQVGSLQGNLPPALTLLLDKRGREEAAVEVASDATAESGPEGPVENQPRGSELAASEPVDRFEEWRTWSREGDLRAIEQAAEEHFKRLPKDGAAWMVLAEARRAGGHSALALEAYTQAIRYGGEALSQEARFIAGGLSLELGDYRGTIELLNTYLSRRAPEAGMATLRLAKAHWGLGQTERARALAERVVTHHRGRARSEAQALLEEWQSSTFAR